MIEIETGECVLAYDGRVLEGVGVMTEGSDRFHRQCTIFTVSGPDKHVRNRVLIKGPNDGGKSVRIDPAHAAQALELVASIEADAPASVVQA